MVTGGTIVLVRARDHYRRHRLAELDGAKAMLYRPWNGSDLLMVVLFLALIQQGGLLLLGRTGSPQDDPTPTTIHDLLILGVGLQVAGLLFVKLLMYLHGCGWRTAFGAPAKGPIAAMRLAGLCYLAIWPIQSIATPLYHNVLRAFDVSVDWQHSLRMLTDPQSPTMLITLLVMAVILAPIVEELLFRGMLLPVMRRHLGIWPAIILSSLLFAAFHLHLPSMVGLFIISVACSLAALIGGSVLPAILLHALFNAISTLLAWTAQPAV